MREAHTAAILRPKMILAKTIDSSRFFMRALRNFKGRGKVMSVTRAVCSRATTPT